MFTNLKFVEIPTVAKIHSKKFYGEIRNSKVSSVLTVKLLNDAELVFENENS